MSAPSTRWRWRLGLIGASVLLGGCDGGATHYVGTHHPSPEGGAPSGAPSTCPPAPGTTRYVSVTSGGVSRRFLLVVPATFEATRAYPVVLGLHARDEDGARARDVLELEAAAPEGAAIFVYPDGLERQWSDGSVAAGWQNGPATTFYGGTEDLTFVRDVVSHLTNELCLRIDELYAVGRWWGGDFASVLGCYAGDLFDAVVTIHANQPYFLPLTADATPPCVGEVAVLVSHGDGDPDFPLEYGLAQRDFWATRNGCLTDAPQPLSYAQLPDGDECVEYPCTEQPLQLCTFATTAAREPPAHIATAALTFLTELTAQ